MYHADAKLDLVKAVDAVELTATPVMLLFLGLLPGEGLDYAEGEGDDVVEDAEGKGLMVDKGVHEELQADPDGKHGDDAENQTQGEVLDVKAFHVCSFLKDRKPYCRTRRAEEETRLVVGVSTTHARPTEKKNAPE